MSPRILPVLLALASCPASTVSDDPDGGDTPKDPVGPGPFEPTPTSTDDPGTTGSGTTGSGTTAASTTGTTASDTGTTTQDTTTLADDETTAPPPGCGDGEVNGQEECDDGHLLNSNSGSCTLSCKNNVCGDGHVEVGVENCDNGIDNSDFIYDGCGTQCERTKFCGDGEVNGPEECDRAEQNGTGEKDADSVACTASCNHASLLVFLSSKTYGALELGGGAYEANARCKELALTAMLPNHQNFKAWLSDQFSSPLESFDPPIPDMPYALKNGLRVADDRAQLLTTGPLTGISITEYGDTMYKAKVWTATGPDGTLLDDALDCENWGSKALEVKARLGISGYDKADMAKVNEWRSQNHWTSAATLSCSNKYHIYCFEQ